MNHHVTAFSAFHRQPPVPVYMQQSAPSSRPPFPTAAGGGQRQAPPHASPSPRNEAEIASFLLQLKHHSPAPCRGYPSDSGGRDCYDHHSCDSKGSYQSHRYSTPPSSAYGPVMTPSPPANRSSPLVLYSSPVTTGSGGGIAPWDVLLSQSTLVLLKDRDLVPDALFVAMAQMVPCRLTPGDRVGCYKTRPIGYLGLCCGHCGGQPGFGRYYPNSVRSLAQTTTSQTILKHVTAKCRYCPDAVRRAVLDLQQLSAEENSPVGRPRYGSRKIFFQRIWQRLHQQQDGAAPSATSSSTGPSSSSASSCCDEEEEEEETTTTMTAASSVTSRGSSTMTKLTLNQSASNETPSDLDEEQSLATYSNDTTDDASTTFQHSGKEASAVQPRWGRQPLQHQVKVTSPVHRLTAD